MDPALQQFELLDGKFKQLYTGYQQTKQLDREGLQGILAEAEAVLSKFNWFEPYKMQLKYALSRVLAGDMGYLSSAEKHGIAAILWELHEILVHNWQQQAIPVEVQEFWRSRWQKGKACYVIKTNDSAGYLYSIYTKAAGVPTHWLKFDVFEGKLDVCCSDENYVRLELLLELLSRNGYGEFGTRTKTTVNEYYSFAFQASKPMRPGSLGRELEWFGKLISDMRDLNFFNNYVNMKLAYNINRRDWKIGRILIITRKWAAFFTGKVPDLVTIRDPKYRKMFESALGVIG